MKTLSDDGTGLVSVAIGTSLLLGTFGWFAVGFGTMTDCTSKYGCTETNCPPCATAERWINAGGIAQWALAGTGVVVLTRRRRAKQHPDLALCGAALLAMSVLTMVGTTGRAQKSYLTARHTGGTAAVLLTYG
jgi:hypothetical protein